MTLRAGDVAARTTLRALQHLNFSSCKAGQHLSFHLGKSISPSSGVRLDNQNRGTMSKVFLSGSSALGKLIPIL